MWVDGFITGLCIISLLLHFTKYNYVIERVIKWLEATKKYIVSFLKNTYGNNYIQPRQFIWGFLKYQSKFFSEDFLRNQKLKEKNGSGKYSQRKGVSNIA